MPSPFFYLNDAKIQSVSSEKSEVAEKPLHSAGDKSNSTAWSEASTLYRSLFSILGAEQLHSITPINIHFNNMVIHPNKHNLCIYTNTKAFSSHYMQL